MLILGHFVLRKSKRRAIGDGFAGALIRGNNIDIDGISSIISISVKGLYEINDAIEDPIFL